MLARRLAVGVAAAVLAVAGFVPAAASGSASSPKTICVGLVIDSRSIGGAATGKCVNVKPGTTGVGVLEAAGHSLTFRRDGLLCTIDGVPSSGCDDVDDTHYWAYFHRAPDATTWSYSNEGMGTYQPANRSTEGWVYDDGTALKPENIPASQMCAGLLKPTSSPTPRATTTHHATATHPPHAATSPASSGSSEPATTQARHRRSPRATPSPTKSAATQPVATPSLSAAARNDSGSVAGSSAGGHGGTGGRGSATGALIAAGVIVVLGGATAIGARRRRR